MRRSRKLSMRQFWAISVGIWVSASVHAGQWAIEEGKGYVVCERLKKHMARYKLPDFEVGRYGSAMLYAFPGWKEPPWQDLDPAQHKELIRKLVRYRVEGAKAYFKRASNKPETNTLSNAEVEEQIAALYKRPFRLRVWRAHLFNIPWDQPESIQTVVQLFVPIAAHEIPDRSPLRPGIPEARFDHESNFIVTDDLRELENRMDEMDGRHLSSYPMRLFGGRLYWLGNRQGERQAVSTDDWKRPIDMRSWYDIDLYHSPHGRIGPILFCEIRHPSYNQRKEQQ